MKWEDKEQLEPDTQYQAEVISAEEGVTAKGAPKIALKLRVPIGRSYVEMFDTLTAAYPPKIKSFCQAAGLMAAYENKSLSPLDCKGKMVKFVTSTETNDRGYCSVQGYVETENDIPF